LKAEVMMPSKGSPVDVEEFTAKAFKRKEICFDEGPDTAFQDEAVINAACVRTLERTMSTGGIGREGVGGAERDRTVGLLVANSAGEA
jgi:hypothetical protein